MPSSEHALGLGRGFDQHDFTVFGGDEQHIPDEQELAVAVAFAFPARVAGGEVDAGQSAVVEAEDGVASQYDRREFRAQVARVRG